MSDATLDRITAAFHAAERFAVNKKQNPHMSVAAIARAAGVHRSLLYKKRYAGISKMISDRRRSRGQDDREALLATKAKQLMHRVSEQRTLIEALGRQCALMKVALQRSTKIKDRSIARLKRENRILAEKNAELMKRLRTVTRLRVVKG